MALKYFGIEHWAYLMKVDPDMRIKIDIYVFITQLRVNTLWYDHKDTITLYIGHQIYTCRKLSESPVFSGVRVTGSILVWPLCCLFLFGLRILIIPLVSSNSSDPKLKWFSFPRKKKLLKKRNVYKKSFYSFIYQSWVFSFI